MPLYNIDLSVLIQVDQTFSQVEGEDEYEAMDAAHDLMERFMRAHYSDEQWSDIEVM